MVFEYRLYVARTRYTYVECALAMLTSPLVVALRAGTHPDARLWENSTLENEGVSEPTEGFRTDSPGATERPISPMGVIQNRKVVHVEPAVIHPRTTV